MSLIGLDDSNGKVDSNVCKGMIDSLLYLTFLRPYKLSSLCLCARFQSNSRESDLTVVKRIFSYLKGTTNFDLLYKKSSDYKLVGLYDVDHAGDKIERKSTSWYLCMFLIAPISWCTKKQPVVALSTCESEYIAGCLAPC